MLIDGEVAQGEGVIENKGPLTSGLWPQLGLMLLQQQAHFEEEDIKTPADSHTNQQLALCKTKNGQQC